VGGSLLDDLSKTPPGYYGHAILGAATISRTASASIQTPSTAKAMPHVSVTASIVRPHVPALPTDWFNNDRYLLLLWSNETTVKIKTSGRYSTKVEVSVTQPVQQLPADRYNPHHQDGSSHHHGAGRVGHKPHRYDLTTFRQ